MIRLPYGRSGHQDFYILEPAMLRNKTACIPYKWFIRGGKFHGLAYGLERLETESGPGWVVREDRQTTITEDDLIWSLPFFEKLGSVSPHAIRGEKSHLYLSCSMLTLLVATVRPDGSIIPSTKVNYTNPWRIKADGRRVLSFMLWLYCDDTSGNVSKKWNKHNSFLFTAAGLPRSHVNQEYNVHFLSTSNTAPPLEMLDGFVELLQYVITVGISLSRPLMMLQ